MMTSNDELQTLGSKMSSQCYVMCLTLTRLVTSQSQHINTQLHNYTATHSSGHHHSDDHNTIHNSFIKLLDALY